MGVLISFLLALLPTVLVIGALVAMPRWMKALFAIYLLFAIRHFLDVGLASTTEDALASLNYLFGGAAMLAFGGILGVLDAPGDRKAFALFVLKYGSAYLAVFTVPKLVLYWQGMTWAEASLIVAVIPYKWLVFIILVVIVKALPSLIAQRRSISKTKSS